MSRESLSWLNSNCLVGFADRKANDAWRKDGLPWYHDTSLQGEPIVYPGAIPVEDVIRRLYNFEAISVPVEYTDAQGNRRADPERQAIIASDTGDLFGVFKGRYGTHQFQDWLVEKVSTLLDDDLAIGSALLLQNRAVAVVTIERPETLETPEGVKIRPYICAFTSHNASFCTTYKDAALLPVCDNSFDAVAFDKSPNRIKIRHTKGATLSIESARQALQILFSTDDLFSTEIAKLCAQTVTNEQWQQVLDALVPVPEEDGRGKTIAENKRDVLGSLWKSDARVAPWTRTAFGVLQAFNTYHQHFATVKNIDRSERAYSNLLTGKTAVNDAQVLQVLGKVVDAQLVAA